MENLNPEEGKGAGIGIVVAFVVGVIILLTVLKLLIN